jgi:hypothetical protein
MAIDPDAVSLAARMLADEGRIIQAGYVAYRSLFVPHDASPRMVTVHRIAFMAGAQHLFSSIMALLEPGDDYTPEDIKRLDSIANELTAFEQELEFLFAKPAGNG